MTNFTDQAHNIRPGEELPTEQLEAFLQAELGLKAPLEIAQFPSGFSNLTYLLSAGEQEFVLRRPPYGSKVKTAHDMGREYRILSQLKPVFDKVPTTYLYTEDDSIIGAPFYLMERVQGVILRAKMPAEQQPAPTLMTGIAQALVDNLVALHQVDYQAAGLGDLGRPEGYLERQIQGWTKRYFAAKTHDFPMVEQAAKWLATHQPRQYSSALIHNDFKYDNLVLNAQDWTQVKAILDWEMSTIGDPLMDLGTSLGYWVNQDDPPWLHALALSPTSLPGNPSRSELVAQYESRSGQALDHPIFYYVYGLFKVIVIVQQIYYRYQKGHTQDPRFAHLDQAVKGLGAMAMQAISKQRLDDLF